MTHITRESAIGFMTARLVRIVPLYWIATVFVLFWTGGGFSNPFYVVPVWAHMIATKPTTLFGWFGTQYGSVFGRDQLFNLVASFAFLPKTQPPVLGVGWTLNIEMFFYIAFWGGLSVSRRFAPIIVCAVLLVFKTAPLVDVIALWGHAYTWFLIAGVGAFYIWRVFVHIHKAISINISKLFVLITTSTSLVAYCILSFTDLSDLSYSTNIALSVVVTTSIILSALMLHSVGFKVKSAWALLLGDASYALYLFHVNVIETLRSMSVKLPWLDFTQHAWAMFIALFASCLLAVAVHLWIERPLLRVLREGIRRIASGNEVAQLAAHAEFTGRKAE